MRYFLSASISVHDSLSVYFIPYYWHLNISVRVCVCACGRVLCDGESERKSFLLSLWNLCEEFTVIILFTENQIKWVLGIDVRVKFFFSGLLWTCWQPNYGIRHRNIKLTKEKITWGEKLHHDLLESIPLLAGNALRCWLTIFMYL